MATGKGGGSKLFGGLNLKDIASQVKERGEASPLERSPAQPTLAAAEMALSGRSMPATTARSGAGTTEVCCPP